MVGVDAKNLIARKPKGVFTHPQQLLGRNDGDEVVTNIQKYLSFPFQRVDDQLVVEEGNLTLSAIDITSLLLANSREIATKNNENIAVRDFCITVPIYWTQQQRQALLDAAEIAGVNVIGFITDGAGVGVNLGITREFLETEPRHVIVYDMGAGSTTVTLLKYQGIKDTKKNSTVGQVEVVSTAWDETLGGREFDYRIAQRFINEIKEKKKLDLSNEKNPKAFVKLMREAQKVKEILSANIKMRVQIEGLVPDYDFVTDLTREEFETFSSDLIARVTAPIETVLKNANLTTSDIQTIEIFGGGLRIPKVKQVIAQYMGKPDVDQHINGDEAAVMGATLYGASQSAGFKVKEFKLKDIIPYGVKASVKSDSGELDKSAELFKAGSRLGSKKTLSFPAEEEFTVTLQYEDSPLLSSTASRLIGNYAVTGLPSHEQYNFTGKPKVHVSIRVNPFGMIQIEKAEAEITILTYPKLNATKTNATITNATTDAESSESASDAPASETASTEAPADGSETSEETEVKPTKRLHRVPLKVTQVSGHGLTPDQFKASRAVMKEIKRRVEEKREREGAKNSVESYIYENREKFQENEDVLAVTTEDQRQSFLDLLSAASTWLDDTSDATDVSEFRAKLREMKTVGDKVYQRIKEITLRPEAVDKARSSLNLTRSLLENITQTLDVKEEDVAEVLTWASDLETWLNEKTEKQNGLAPHEDLVFTSEEVTRRWTRIETRLRQLLRKPKRKPAKKVVEETITEEPAETETPPAEDTETQEPVEEPTATEEPASERHDEL
eukprot:TRINITY_DN4188_c0_g1_i1.p1 TRINITY_DN4188_c0_g1~~TRINITY_DN4188_c0_g1_i1.p1  ORF type:complete len:876 (-),score=301.19 TRINITY_DN4188_c0_g1_i1:19-2376(-)